ncbi:hypothetical protein IV203_032009 [Nitzschia inconspicua]|uniref:DUF6824 domain-containing protein n=1 Tax=Nitzschia inconspicua TaxID=303405 RepID=A0A9K3Q353_9STRA|nr:hypothetical protein IV203_032009 [Nitzschia inconspicua]
MDKFVSYVQDILDTDDNTNHAVKSHGVNVKTKKALKFAARVLVQAHQLARHPNRHQGFTVHQRHSYRALSKLAPDIAKSTVSHASEALLNFSSINSLGTKHQFKTNSCILVGGNSNQIMASANDEFDPVIAFSSNVDEGELDKILAQDMNGLSTVDRDRIQEEIHGVYNLSPPETPDSIETALKEFQQHIVSVPAERSMAYIKALSLNSQFVHNRDFRLKFIRAELYQIPKAVNRFLAYLDVTYHHFGQEVLLRPILQLDLTKEEVEVMRKGVLQLLSSRDRAGRLVVVHQGAMLAEGFHSASRARVSLYFLTVVSDDITSQRTGLVGVFSLHPDSRVYLSAAEQRSMNIINKSCPIRYSAMHVILPSDPIFWQMKIAFLFNVMTTKTDRVRTKMYKGGMTMETQYKLMTYGIPALPITSTGQIKNKFHVQWLKNQRTLESIVQGNPDKVEKWILIPETNDVLFRGGSGNIYHYGNLEFELLVESKLPAYEGSKDRKVKKAVRAEVIDAVRSGGGRFLEMNKEHRNVWVEVSDMEALHNKLYAFFYQHKKRLESRATRQNSDSETLQFLESQTKRPRTDTLGGCF